MNATVTNVPGSPVQLYMCGAQIIDSFGMGPIAPGMGLFHTVNSMVMKNKGVITLAFVSCISPRIQMAAYTVFTHSRPLVATRLISVQGDP